MAVISFRATFQPFIDRKEEIPSLENPPSLVNFYPEINLKAEN